MFAVCCLLFLITGSTEVKWEEKRGIVLQIQIMKGFARDFAGNLKV